jgi:hypothetical protein
LLNLLGLLSLPTLRSEAGTFALLPDKAPWFVPGEPSLLVLIGLLGLPVPGEEVALRAASLVLEPSFGFAA